MYEYQHSIVLPARWETSSILEWIAYHRSIGFDHVYLYCNDDDPTELFDQICCYLATPEPFVTFIHYPFQGLQWDIYLHWFRHYAHETEWGAFLDADEFLTLPGLDDIRRFMFRFPPDCDAVHFHWIYYGTSGFLERPTGSVLRQYTKREAKVSYETKTMVRTSRIQPDRLRPEQTVFWHLWDRSQGHDLQCYSSLVEQVPVPFNRSLLASERAEEIRQTAFIAHFALKSEADFMRRLERGVGGQFAGQRIWAESIVNGEARGYLTATNAEQNLYLKEYWERTLGVPAATSIVSRPPGPNLAIGCQAMQSSTSVWSKQKNPAHDAVRAISGIVSGRAAFHTDKDIEPWWQVDLGRNRTVQEIRVFNRVDDMGVAARNNRLIISASADGDAWQELYRRNSDTPFGGADGNPLIWHPEVPVTTRYLRLTVPTTTWLSLDQVEVY